MTDKEKVKVYAQKLYIVVGSDGKPKNTLKEIAKKINSKFANVTSVNLPDYSTISRWAVKYGWDKMQLKARQLAIGLMRGNMENDALPDAIETTGTVENETYPPIVKPLKEKKKKIPAMPKEKVVKEAPLINVIRKAVDTDKTNELIEAVASDIAERRAVCWQKKEAADNLIIIALNAIAEHVQANPEHKKNLPIRDLQAISESAEKIIQQLDGMKPAGRGFDDPEGDIDSKIQGFLELRARDEVRQIEGVKNEL